MGFCLITASNNKSKFLCSLRCNFSYLLRDLRVSVVKMDFNELI
jgi:hypothetical protein